MKITKAVITAAGRDQRTLPLHLLVDRDGVKKTALQIILEEALAYSGKEALAVALEWRKRLAGRRHGDSARLVREDRNR